MGLTDILVHLDHLTSCGARLEVAISLARQHQARLTGLLVVRHRYPTEAAVAAAQSCFEQRVAAAGIKGRWQCVDGSSAGAGMTEVLLSRTPSSDLLVIGQGSGEAADVGVPFDLPERLVLEAGLPVLIVPYAGTFATVGERVLVAWKAGRESTRALNDALPILQRAHRVEIMAKKDADTYGGMQGGQLAELFAHLAKRGVVARPCSLLTRKATLGDALLNRVCDEGFDLLVLGAYAHGEEGSRAFGSVARQLLKQMTVPVLMSH